MKIGILIKEFKDLSNWQLRVIKAIIDDPTLDLNVVILQSKIQNQTDRNTSRRFYGKFGLGRFLLAIQVYIERKVFFKEMFSVDTESLKQTFEKLAKIKISNQDKSRSGVSTTIEQMHQQSLDLIVNLEISEAPVELRKIPKYGIWKVLPADINSSSLGPPGFSEVLHNWPSIGFTLLKHTTNNQAEVIDHSFFNRTWSMVESATLSMEGGVSVLQKNLKRLQSGYKFDSISFTIPDYKNPGIFQVIKYIAKFYLRLSSKIMKRVSFKLWGQRHECWSIFIGKGLFLESEFSKKEALKMPKDEFWADPFLFRYQKNDYVFFENFSYKTNRGKISCGRVKNEELCDITDVLDLDYHLSFPFIFQENGDVFLMPETSENKRLEIYRALDFPAKWELYTTAFEGEMVADAFFYEDERHQKWLFVNKQAATTSPMNSELFIYKVDSIKLDNLQPHTQNPVIIDASVARNGGAVFKHKNELYRPSQRNIEGIYGRALNINRIKKLTIDEYEEETIHIFKPDFDKNLIAAHHLHQLDNLFVFDAAFRAK